MLHPYSVKNYPEFNYVYIFFIGYINNASMKVYRYFIISDTPSIYYMAHVNIWFCFLLTIRVYCCNYMVHKYWDHYTVSCSYYCTMLYQCWPFYNRCQKDAHSSNHCLPLFICMFFHTLVSRFTLHLILPSSSWHQLSMHNFRVKAIIYCLH